MATKDLLTEDDDLPRNGTRVELDLTPEEQKVLAAKDDMLTEEDEREIEEQHPDANSEERDSIRERRRLEKLERKERREKAISRDKLELDFLRKRNDELERRMSTQEVRAHNADLANLDGHIQKALNEVGMAEQVIAKAVAAGNGEDVAQAMRYRDQAMTRANQLGAMKNQAVHQPATPQQPAIDDLTLHYAQQFVSENKWYDPQGRDEDSAIVLAIDQALVKDGYDPKSEEYWEELRKRASRRLPEKFSARSPVQREPRGGPAIGSGKEHAPGSTRREVYISPERKQALVDAGVWDDPVLRQKYVKRYMEYDRTNRA